TAIETALSANDEFTVTFTNTTGSGTFNPTTDTDPTVANVGATTTGVTASGGISADVVLELTGTNGSEVLSFGAGTGIDDLVKGINLVKDATGVEATANGTTLELVSTTYGSNAIVDLS